MESSEVESYIRRTFAEFARLTDEEIFGGDPTLQAVIVRSPTMTNSIDLMEAFARTSNALRREHGVRVKLPTLSLETPMSQVLEFFLREFDRQTKGAPV
jgi:hypothetical protein